MDWKNELFVKLYTRDTLTWKRIGWQGRCLLMHLMRICDRSGWIDHMENPISDLSEITEIPYDHVKDGYSALIRFDVAKYEKGRIHLTNFEEAQSARQSAKARKQEQRLREKVVSRNVTRCHAKSRDVTKCHDENRIEENRIDEKEPLQSLSAPSGLLEPVANRDISPIENDSGKKDPFLLAIPVLTNVDRAPGSIVWNSYSESYEKVYGQKPVRNARANSHCKQLVKLLGADEAPTIASYYPTTTNPFYAASGHSLAMLVRDAEKIRTEWANGKPISFDDAKRKDIRAHNEKVWDEIIQKFGD